MRRRLLIMGLVLSYGPLLARGGSIEGVVIDGSRSQPAGEGIEVMLRVPFDGRFVVAAQTRTRADASFRFDDLPLDIAGPYLPGANLDGIHFPGARIQLDPSNPNARILLKVFQSSSGPCPLVTERHTVVIEADSGLLTVRETMVIKNPSTVCYVGRPRHPGGGPVTLELRIPAEFQQITFDREGFGRTFQIINGKLVTGVPWPPGKRELGFTYAIPNHQADRAWRRPLDLPTDDLEVTITGVRPRTVTTNLPRARQTPEAVVFRSDAMRTALAPEYIVHVRLDHLPVPLMARLRWFATFLLLGLSLALSAVVLRGRNKLRRQQQKSSEFEERNGDRLVAHRRLPLQLDSATLARNIQARRASE